MASEPSNVVPILGEPQREPEQVEAPSLRASLVLPGSEAFGSACNESSPDPIFKEMARLLNRASETLDSAAAILSEMGEGLRDEAKRLG